MLKVGSLFSGIGGFDVAARWMGWRTVWVSEIDQFCNVVLAHHFPDAPNHGDITAIDFTTVEPVDVLVGGFPCQDISIAGRKEGITGSRSGLWKEYVRAICELRPRYVVVENVSAIRHNGIDTVLRDLAEVGYDAEWSCFGAENVGAPHKRERFWLLAYPRSQCVADTFESGREGGILGRENTEREGVVGHTGCSGAVCEQQGQDWWATEPNVGRVAHGVPARVAQLRALGNAIVPQCASVVYQEIAKREQLSGPAVP